MNVMALTTIMLPTKQTEQKLCPCCLRLVRSAPDLMSVETCTAFHQDPKVDTSSVVILNSEIMNPINALEDSNLSMFAQKKLRAYLRAREHVTSSGPGDRKSLVFRQTFVESDLSFLTRKPYCTENTYMSPKSKPSYQNETTAEILKLAKIFEMVQECPWYWGEMNKNEANKILADQPLGTFLLRNSSDKRFLFSLSVVTEFGPTSIRIVYSDGKFSFDSFACERSHSTQAADEYETCVIYMILRHTEYLNDNDKENLLSNQKESIFSSILPPGGCEIDKITNSKNECKVAPPGVFLCSWMGPNGVEKFPLVLVNPHSKGVPTLNEKTRLSINKELALWKNPKKAENLPLSSDFRKYLKLYPYPI